MNKEAEDAGDMTGINPDRERFSVPKAYDWHAYRRPVIPSYHGNGSHIVI